MRMQIKATSFVANTRRGRVDVLFGGQHQGESVSIRLQFPVSADPSLSQAQIFDAAWVRAQQILRCATLVAQPEGQLGRVERPAQASLKPINIALEPSIQPLPAVPAIGISPIHPALWS